MFVLPCTLLATFYLARRNPAPRFMSGILSGIGVPLLILAFVNRRGPGTVCADGRCEQLASPWPWLVSGVLFLLLGVAAYVLFTIRRRGV